MVEEIVKDDKVEHIEQLQQEISQDPSNIHLRLQLIEAYRKEAQLTLAQDSIDNLAKLNQEAAAFPQALQYLSLGQIAKAELAFSELLAKHPHVPLIAHNLAFCLLALSYSQKADALLTYYTNDETLEHCPQLFILAARIKHHLHELDDALDLLKQVQVKHPQLPDNIGLMALLHYEQSQTAKALEFAQHAISMDSNNLDARLVLLLNEMNSGKSQVKMIAERLSKQGDDARLWLAMAYAHIDAKHIDEAELAFKKACELLPTFIHAWHALAWCQLLLDNATTAELSFKKALELNPKLDKTLAGLAVIAALNNDIERSQQLVREASTPNTPIYSVQVANALCLAHQAPKQALESFSQINDSLAQAPHRLEQLIKLKIQQWLSTSH